MASRSEHVGGANFAYADGSVRILSYNIPQDIYRGLSSRNGGGAPNWDE